MPDNIIAIAVTRSNRLRVFMGVTLILVTVAAIVLGANFYRNALEGPYEMDLEQLGQLESLDGLQRYFVTVPGDNAYQVAFELSGSDGFSGSEQQYLLLELPSDRLMLIEDNRFDDANTYTGALSPISTTIQTEVVDDLVRRRPDLQERIAPFMLSNRDLAGDAFAGGAASAVTITAGIMFLTTGLRRSTKPSLHPIYRQLQRFGAPEAIADEIDTELRAGGQKFSEGIALTHGWFVKQGRGSLIERWS